MRYLIAAWLILMASLMVEGCAHTQPPTVTHCLPLRPYTDAEKAALKAAYDALPKDSILRLSVEDLTKTREEVRAACSG